MRLLLYTLLIISTSSFAQISHKPKTLNFITKPSGGENLFEIYFTNNQSTSLNVYWKVIKDTSWNASWETYICDLEFCYGTNIDKSNPGLPNKFSQGTHKFEFHFDPKGIRGKGNVILKLYSDKDFASELYSVDISLLSTDITHSPNPLVLNTTPTTGDNKLNITFSNNADTNYTAYWKLFKDPVTWKASWDTYICDLEFCYGNNIDQSNPSLSNKFTKGNHLVEFHFFPNNIIGCSIIGMKLYGDKNFTQEIYNTTIEINNCLSGAKDISNETNIRVFPNPSANHIRIENDENIQILEIYDIIGHKLNTINHIPHSEVDISALNPGLYLGKMINFNGITIGVAKFQKY
jgi:hypothetical protein